MTKQFVAVLALALVSLSAGAQDKTLRAGDMTADQWSKLAVGGPQNIAVEFRQGDEIPVSFSSEGDLLEATQTGVSYVKVKRSFWLRVQQNEIEMSLDGSTFKPLKEMISGSFTAGSGASHPGVPVNAINLVLQASLK